MWSSTDAVDERSLTHQQSMARVEPAVCLEEALTSAFRSDENGFDNSPAKSQGLRGTRCQRVFHA